MAVDSPPADLRAFLGLLRSDRDLVEVKVEVDPCLEVAEIHRRVVAAGGPALLFTNVRGHRMPVVTNLFGTARRVERAFGHRPERLIARAAALPQVLMPPSPAKLWRQRDLLPVILNLGTRTVAGAPVL